jgi:hypothetical protein
MKKGGTLKEFPVTFPKTECCHMWPLLTTKRLRNQDFKLSSYSQNKEKKGEIVSDL